MPLNSQGVRMEMEIEAPGDIELQIVRKVYFGKNTVLTADNQYPAHAI